MKTDESSSESSLMASYGINNVEPSRAGNR
jgi:hypothetical protein